MIKAQMQKMVKRSWRVAALSLAVGATIAAGTGRADSVAGPDMPLSGLAQGGAEVGHSLPSLWLKALNFPSQGLIAECNIKPGDHVKVGKVLMVQDTRVDEKELDDLKLEADSNVAIEAAETNWKEKCVERDRLKKLHDNGSTTDEEYEKAKLEADLAQFQIDKAKLEKKQAAAKVERQKTKIETMRLVSTVDGIVEKVDYNKGEMSDPQKAVCTIAVNNPLWVEVDLPIPKARQLKAYLGRIAEGVKVRYPEEPKSAGRAVKLIFLAPVADAGGNVQKARFELDNSSEQRDAGMPMLVDLDGADAGAKDAAARGEAERAFGGLAVFDRSPSQGGRFGNGEFCGVRNC